MELKQLVETMSLETIYSCYISKAEKKGRTKSEVDEIIRWLTGYSQEELRVQLEKQIDFETFFVEASQLNPPRAMIKGVVCGVREWKILRNQRCGEFAIWIN